jgi:hypothetical protein
MHNVFTHCVFLCYNKYSKGGIIVPNKTDVIRISYVADATKGTIESKILPRIKRGKSEDIRPYLSAVLSSINLGLTAVLADIPVLRPATEAEVSAKVYIFKEEKDNALYQSRKAIHDAVAKVFDDTLKNLFPDIRFIHEAIEHQQYAVTEMTEQEAEEHKRFIEDLAKEVREDE